MNQGQIESRLRATVVNDRSLKPKTNSHRISQFDTKSKYNMSYGEALEVEFD